MEETWRGLMLMAEAGGVIFCLYLWYLFLKKA